VHAISLAPGQEANFLLLFSTAEIEASDILSRRRFILADLDQILSAGDFFPDRLAVIQVFPRLVDARYLYGFS
jgi:hypothetical protein